MAKLFSPRNKLVLPRGIIKQPQYLLDSSHPLSRGLIGCWPLGDSPNSINKDLSLCGRNMSVGGTAASANPGSHHGGLAFSTNARAAYPTTAFPLLSYPLTMVVWANYPSAPGFADGYIFMSLSASGANQGWSLEIANGAGTNGVYIQCSDTTNTRKLHSTVVPTANAWHQYVGVFQDSSTFILYVDGALQSLTADSTQNPVPTLGDTVTIGNYIYIGGNYHILNGFVEGGRVYNRALSQSEISWLYAEPYAGLVPANANLFGSGQVNANVNLTGVSATAAAGSLTVESDASVALTGINATAAFNTFGATTEVDVNLTSAFATGAVGTFASYALSINMSGVSSTAHAGAFLSGTTINISKATSSGLVGIFQVDVVPIIFVVGVYTIMRNNPVAASGLMSNDVVACQGDF